MTNPIIVPLDVPDRSSERRLLDRLADSVEIVKIGKQLFTSEGPDSVRIAHAYGKRVFLDLKYHDIPNTVAEAVRSAATLGVWMLNVHVSGGGPMVQAARKASDGAGSSPLLIGVTVLTSLDDELWRDVFGDTGRSIESQVVHMARVACQWELDGVIASPQEVAAIRNACGTDPPSVTPGVRPSASGDDQRRTMTPGDAIRAGADYLVIGRPITEAADPAGATRAILEDIETARVAASAR